MAVEDFGMLESYTQQIMQVLDPQLKGEVGGLRKDIGSLERDLTDWKAYSKSYYTNSLKAADHLNDSADAMLGSLDLTRKSVERLITTSISRLNTNADVIHNDLVEVKADVRAISTNTSSIANALTVLDTKIDTLITTLSTVRTTGPQSISAFGGGVVDVNLVSISNPPVLVKEVERSAPPDVNPVPVVSPDLGSIDFSGIYGGFDTLDSTLGDIKNSVEDYLWGYLNDQDGAVDYDDLVNGVSDMFTGFVTDFETSFRTSVIPEFENFFTGFLDGLNDTMNPPGDTTAMAEVPTIPDYSVQLDALDNLIDDFYRDTSKRLDVLHSDMQGNSGAIWARGAADRRESKLQFDDEINAFDEVTNSNKQGNKILSGIWDFFNKNFMEVSAAAIGAAVAAKLDRLHKDTTLIIQATGKNNWDAHKVIGDVNKNIFKTFGRSTFSGEERSAALEQQLRSGMVATKHLEQATEAAITFEKLTGTTVDFAQGWEKSLLITESKADDYLESVALSIDNFSNNFFVSADKLKKAADDYAVTARIFTNDFKGFSKAMDSAVKVMAAQENNNIMSMNPEEFLHHLQTTYVGDWSEADFLRLQRAGIGNGVAFADQLTTDYEGAASRFAEGMQASGEQLAEMLKKGGASGQAARYMFGQLGMSPDEGFSYADEVSQGRWGDFAEQIKDTTFDNNYSQGQVEGEATTRTKEAQNNTVVDKFKNVIDAFGDSSDSWANKVLGALEGVGISGGIAGALTTIIAGKGLSLLGKAATRVIASGAGAGAAGAGAAGAAGAGTGGLGGLIATITGGGGGAGILGKFLGSGKGLISRTGTIGMGNFGGIPRGMGSFGDMARGSNPLGTIGQTTSKAGNFAKNGFSKLAKSPLGEQLQYLASPTNANVASYGGKGSKVVKALGSKGALALSTVETIFDAGIGVNNAKDWLGADDYEATIASGIGGALGGNSKGLSGAVSGALKWGTIGTTIAGPIGTAVGGVLGAALGAIGGENIAKGINKVTGFAGDVNDKVDVWLEDNLGIIGHGLAAAKDSAIDFTKDQLGGLFKGLGSTIGGIKDGFGKIIHGDFLGGIKSIGSGMFQGVKDVGEGITKAYSDVWKDWTTSAKDRISERTKDIKKQSDLADEAQKAADKKTSSVGEQDATKKGAQIKHTGRSAFRATTKPRGMDVDVSKYNAFAFTDTAAEQFIANDTPIDHSADFQTTKKKSAAFVDQLNNNYGEAARLFADNQTSAEQMRRATSSTILDLEPKNPLINTDTDSSKFSSPVVDAITASSTEETMLLRELLAVVKGNGGKGLTAGSSVQAVKPFPASPVKNRGDQRTSNFITNYQGIAMQST